MKENLSAANDDLTFLYKKENGTIDDLLERFSEREINQLELIGKIHCGCTSTGEKVWAISKETIDDYKTYRKSPNFIEVAIGYAMSALGLRMYV